MYFRSIEEKNVRAELDSPKPSLFHKRQTLRADIPRDEVTLVQSSVAKPLENPVVESVSKKAARELAVEEPSDAEQVEIAWDEVNTAWQTELKDYLFSVDPEHAEKIFEAYMKAGSTYRETPEDNKSDDVIHAHLENLKEVFGGHFEAVQNLHQEYVNTIQDQAGPEAQLLLQL